MEGPHINKQEMGVERIPTKEEVLREIFKHCENPSIKRELRDGKGLYLFEAEIAGEKAGETTEYIYQRKGVFPESKTLETVINVAYFETGVPVGGNSVTEYNAETKTWK